MKSIFRNRIVLIIIVIILSINVFTKPSAGKHINPIHQPVEYTQISYKNIERTPYIARWYKKYLQKEGIHFRTYKGDSYILISAGKKPTDGYKTILSKIGHVSRCAIYIRANIIQPPSNKIVTQASTYPNLLIKISDPHIVRVEGIINELR